MDIRAAEIAMGFNRDAVLALRGDVVLTRGNESSVVLLCWPGRRLTLRRNSPAAIASLQRLAAQGGTFEELAREYGVAGEDAGDSLPRLIATLVRHGILRITFTVAEKQLVTAIPCIKDGIFRTAPVEPGSRYRLSRFAYLRRQETELILESPLVHGIILLHDWQGAALIAMLGESSSVPEISAQLPGLPEATIALFIGLLLSMEMLEGARELAGAADEPLALWDFHNLLFHSRSRQGRSLANFGYSDRFLATVAAPPLLKPFPTGETISLPKPDLATIAGTDLPFTAVLEQRRSWRSFGANPVTLQQLGEFLYRSARERKPEKTDHMEIGSRPYPCSGALYELDVYLLIHKCSEVGQGLYCYDPAGHQLCLVSPATEATRRLLEGAAFCTAASEIPPVLVIYSARFSRIFWKYETIAYSLLLKDVGVLMQTMSLVATSMGLASCILGSGDSDAFAAAANSDYYTESSVGEFVLGTIL